MVRVRPAMAGDAAAWQRMREALWPDGATGHADAIARFFAGTLREPLEVLLAVDDSGATLGFAELSIRSSAEDCVTDRVAYLEGWYVAPEARRGGVGRTLVAAAEEWARAKGCTEFASDTTLDNDVSALAHRALGFEETAQLRCFRKRLRPLTPRPGASSGSAQEALARLREGNARFAANVRGSAASLTHARRAALAARQDPFAIILGCSDSRVPAELVFDQGLGDLFVIRVAGNIVAPSQVGSVEFAAERFGTRLVVVLGHSQCGAVLATLDELRGPTQGRSRNLRAIVDRVRPALEPLVASGWTGDAAGLVRAAVRANIRASARQLRHGSEVLEQLIQDEGLLVVGAEYSLETGQVDFFDSVPESR